MGDITQSQEAFKREIKQLVSQISRIREAELEEHLLVREELGIDSLMAMEILATCEKRFNLQLDETLFAEVQTVGDFLALMIRLKDNPDA